MNASLVLHTLLLIILWAQREAIKWHLAAQDVNKWKLAKHYFLEDERCYGYSGIDDLEQLKRILLTMCVQCRKSCLKHGWMQVMMTLFHLLWIMIPYPAIWIRAQTKTLAFLFNDLLQHVINFFKWNLLQLFQNVLDVNDIPVLHHVKNSCSSSDRICTQTCFSTQRFLTKWWLTPLMYQKYLS